MVTENLDLPESTKNLRAAILDKLGKSTIPATIGDLAPLYVHALLTTELATILSDLEGDQDEEGKQKTIVRLRTVIETMAMDFGSGLKRAVEKHNKAQRDKRDKAGVDDDA